MALNYRLHRLKEGYTSGRLKLDRATYNLISSENEGYPSKLRTQIEKLNPVAIFFLTLAFCISF